RGRVPPSDDVGRVNVPVEEREAETKGARFALTWGDEQLNLKFGAAYDEISRDIRARGNDALWQAAVCGGNPANIAQQPNSQPPCRGETAAEIVPGVGGYPDYAAPYQGSLIPNAAVPSYLRPTKYGFVTVDWKSFARDSNYAHYRDTAPEAGGLPTTASWGSISEEATALFAQLNGDRKSVV